MSTPLKTSLLLSRSQLSPRSPRLLCSNNRPILSPITVNTNQLTSYPNKIIQKCEKVKNNPIKLNIFHEYADEESLTLDTPHKENLLNYGLSKCDLLYSLGKGSYGTVIKGKYKSDIVAVKIVKLKNCSDVLNEENARFLLHKNVIRILDIIISEKYGLIIMEYHKNSKNLQDVIDDGNIVLNKEAVVVYSRDVANGLKYCHENYIIHLDIKPKNVLLCDNTICKICDFGNCAKEFDTGQKFKHLGTVAYTAPEILKGENPSTKCDIYSLGILIWQLLSRKCPYESLDSEVVIYKVVKFNFRPFLTSKDQELSKLCSMCWNANPKSRPNTSQVCDILNTIFINVTASEM